MAIFPFENEEREVQRCHDLPSGSAVVQAGLEFSFSLVDLVLASWKRNVSVKLLHVTARADH